MGMKTLLMFASLVLAFSLRAQVNQAHLRGTTNSVQTQLNQKWPLNGNASLLSNVTISGGYRLAYTLDEFNLDSANDAAVNAQGIMTLSGVDQLDLHSDGEIRFRSPLVELAAAQTGGALELTSAAGAVEFKVNRVATVAALKALPASAYQNGAIIRTLGYYSAGDGGSGVYRYDSASAATADDGLVIAPAHGTGRFLLQHSGTVSLGQFGAKGDTGVTDNTPYMTAAVAALNAGTIRKLTVPIGTFYVNGMYTLTANNITIEGFDNGGSSTLVGHRTTTGNTTLFRVYGSGNAVRLLGLTRSDNTGSGAGSPIAYQRFFRIENSVDGFLLEKCYIDGNASGQIARTGYYYVEIDCFGHSSIGVAPRNINIIQNFWTDTSSRAIDLNGVIGATVSKNYFYRCGTQNYTATGNLLNPGTCIEFASFNTGGTNNPSRNIVVSENRGLVWGDGFINFANVVGATISGNSAAGAATIGENYVVAGAGYDGENAIAVFGGENIAISGNNVDRVRLWAYYVRSQSIGGSYFFDLKNVTITGNTARGGTAPNGNPVSSAYTVSGLEAGVVVENVVVSGNTWIGTDNRSVAMSVDATGSGTTRNVAFLGNVITGPGAGGASSRGIAASLTGTSSNIMFNDNLITGFDVGIYNASNWANDTVALGNLIASCTTPVSNSGSLGVYSGSSFFAARGSASTTLAQSGAFRMSNGSTITARNNANSADLTLIAASASDVVQIAGGVLDANASTGAIRTSSTGKLTLSAPSASTVSAGATFTSTGTTHQISGNGGAVTLSTTTGITAGTNNGQILILCGMDNTNTVTVPDSGNCFLAAARVLGLGDSLVLQYRTANGSLTAGWYELSYSDN